MKWKDWKLIVLVVVIGAIVCVVTYAGRSRGRRTALAAGAKPAEYERRVTETEVPAAALVTLKKLAAGAEITVFAEEAEHGSTFYEGSWKAPSGANMDVLVTPTGDLVEIEEQVGADQVPAAVLAAAREAAGRGAELAFEKKTMLLYEVKFRKGNRRHELLLTPDGRRVEEEIEKGKGDEDDDEEGVLIDDVPNAVRATILKYATGGEIEEIERETEDGKVVYEVAVIIGGKEVELKVAANGKLLSKEVEGEDDDDEDDDDEEEDDDDEDEDDDDEDEDDDDEDEDDDDDDEDEDDD